MDYYIIEIIVIHTYKLQKTVNTLVSGVVAILQPIEHAEK